MHTHTTTTNPAGGTWRLSLAMALSGTIGLFVLASGQDTWNVVWFRCLVGAVVLLVWLMGSEGWKPLNRSALGWLLLGAAALITNWLLLFSSYHKSGIAVATVVYHVQPFFLILLVALVQRQHPDWYKMPWLALAFVGVALTAGVQWGVAQQADMLAGVALALAAAFLYAVATLATRKLSGIAPAQIAGLQLLVGVVVLAPWTDFSMASFTAQTWVSLLTLGLVHTGLMYNLMYTAFQRLAAERIAVLSFIYPLVAIAVDVSFFHLALGGIQVLGMFLILLALVAHQRDWKFPLAFVALRRPANVRSARPSGRQ